VSGSARQCGIASSALPWQVPQSLLSRTQAAAVFLKLCQQTTQLGMRSPPTKWRAAAWYIRERGRLDNQDAWKGMADEVAIYTTALSSSDVLGHYQNGTAISSQTASNLVIKNA
jgi:hypothetical protein